MQFTGRIMKVLPTRSGTSNKTGQEWKALPFIFEYFENPTDRYSDKVLLESFDVTKFAQIREGAQVRIGFGHSVREWTNQQGQTQTFNEVRMYSFEVIGQQGAAPVAQPTGQPAQQPATTTARGNSTQQPQNQETDDLPF